MVYINTFNYYLPNATCSCRPLPPPQQEEHNIASLIVFLSLIAIMFTLATIASIKAPKNKKQRNNTRTTVSSLKRGSNRPNVFLPVVKELVKEVTRKPAEFPEENLELWTGTQFFENLIPEAKILCIPSDANVKTEYSNVIRKLDRIMTWIFKLYILTPEEFQKCSTNKNYVLPPRRYVPTSAQTISIKMESFAHGEKCHEFLPLWQTSEDSYYTYEMFGDFRIQVTRFVENGVTYVAGFCIYVECGAKEELYDEDCIRRIFTEPRRVSQKITKPGSCPSPKNLIDPKEDFPADLIIRHCPKLERNIISKIKEEVMMHQYWDPISQKMIENKCEECTNEIKELESAPPPTYASLSLA